MKAMKDLDVVFEDGSICEIFGFSELEYVDVDTLVSCLK
jgi:hypothetical protein